MQKIINSLALLNYTLSDGIIWSNFQVQLVENEAFDQLVELYHQIHTPLLIFVVNCSDES